MLARLLALLGELWNPPKELPRALDTEWRLIAGRWLGILLMLPTVRLILPPEHEPAAYALLAGATVFNLSVRILLRRKPALFMSGFLTTLCDGLLNVGMISLAGGFDSPVYFVIYTVTISAAMRYGYRPTAALVTGFVACDLIESQIVGSPIGGAFLVRSGFLALTGLLGCHLRQQAWGAQRALQHQLQRAEHEALHDRLTGLPNRTLLTNRIEECITAADGSPKHPALLMVDLNRFKDVNDTLGHHVGDMLLVQVGARFLQALPPEATVARLGGDEFAVVLPEGDVAAAADAARSIQTALEALFAIEAYNLDVDASIGIAVYPQHGGDATSLLRHADVAMYVAKRAGEKLAVYAADIDQHSPQRLAMVGELREAIDAGDLVLQFQPKLAIESGQLIGAEALVRWRRPNGLIVQPDLFIPVAEQTGLIRPLTRWVVNEALSHICAWREMGLEVSVAVNLSMRDLHDRDLPGIIEQLLARWNVPPSGLVLEITESSLMADPNTALATARELSDIGIRLAIDDFGTGYSSLSYLKRLPVHELKIDKSFVGNMAHDEEDATIVRSIVGLAHDLGLDVVAEGVEDNSSWIALRRLGCDVAQGYLISRPLPANEFFDFARTHAGPRQQAARPA